MKYRNDSAQDLWLPGVGEVKAGATIETDVPFHNANFSLVTEKEAPKPEKAKESKKDEANANV